MMTESESKNEVACNKTNEQLPESLTSFDSMQTTVLSKQKTVIACVNLITDYKQHVVVQYLISPASQPVSQSVSRMSIL